MHSRVAVAVERLLVQKDEENETKTIFGTRNGYDQGGTEALCWKTTWKTTSDLKNVSNNLIEQSNAEMFALSQQSQLLPECYQNTQLRVVSYNFEEGSDNEDDDDMDDDDKPKLFLGRPYTIQMELQMDFATVPIDLLPITNATTNTTSTTFPNVREVYFRLHLCDTIQQGLCNPMRDTRAADAQLTRQESDQPLDSEEEQEPFPDTVDKWVYNPNVTLNGLTGDTNHENDGEVSYYYGRWCKWKLRRQNETTVYRTLIPVTIEFPLPSPDMEDLYNTLGARPFFFVGQAVVPLGLDTNGEQVRLDIAQTVPSKVVYVSPPPTIATVDQTTKITLAVIIGTAGLFALGCFLAIVLYRKHAIMRLAQGPFLAVMAAACCMQIVFSFTHLPIKDVYCKLRGPLVELPIALVGAVLVGRVWRIYGTLSTVHRIGRSSSDTTKKPFLDTYLVGCLNGLARLPHGLLICCKSKTSTTKSSRKSIRSAVTANETWCLIGMLMLPQIALQVYALIVNNAELVTEMNQLQNVGRVVCGNMDDWITMTGTSISCILYVLAVIMAWLSRDLPFALNEKDPIFHTATICAIITAMSIAIGKVIDDPSTPPNAVVLLQSIVSIGIALTVLLIMIWPKIHRAYNGQAVVMSQVLGSSFSKSISSESSSSTQETKTATSGSGDVLTTTTTWNEKEALPSHIESQILQLQSTFRSITDKCGNGCTLSKSEWQSMQESIQQLSADLHQVHVG